MRKLLFALLACMTISAFAGNEKGNGGDTVPNAPVSIGEITNVILNDSKIALKLYFNGIEKQLGSKPDYSFMYPSIINKLESVKIEIRTTMPCYDDGKNIKDGSINSSYKDHICISAFLLSKKLNQQEYKYQIFGLIAHELSHLLGADERIAVKLQNDIIDSFTFVNLDLKKLEFKESIDLLNEATKALGKIIHTNDWNGLEQFEYIENILPVYKKLTDSTELNLISTIDRFYANIERNRFGIVKAFKVSSDPMYSEKERNYYNNFLNNLFGDQKEITVFDYFVFIQHQARELHKQSFLANPQNIKIAKSELNKTMFFFISLTNKAFFDLNSKFECKMN